MSAAANMLTLMVFPNLFSGTRQNLMAFSHALFHAPARCGDEDLLGKVVPVVGIKDLLVCPCKRPWGVKLPEWSGTRCYVRLVEQPLVVAPLPASLVQGIQCHPAPAVAP